MPLVEFGGDRGGAQSQLLKPWRVVHADLERALAQSYGTRPPRGIGADGLCPVPANGLLE